MIIIIDNYDSFTYNLCQLIGTMYSDIRVFRNDQITISEIEIMNPQAIVISPGPGYPCDAGISTEAIKYFSGKIPLLGVCLGHQAIVEAFGGKIIKATELMHGKSSEIIIDTKSTLFSNLPEQITAARYHSLIAQSCSIPQCLKITAYDSSEQIMAVEHKEHKTYGLQFHPESILTQTGKRIIANFLIQIDGFTLPANYDSGIEKEKTELKKYISKIADKSQSLTIKEAYDAVLCIMKNEATDAQISSLLTAMKMKGETIEEITGFAKGMRAMATEIHSCRDSIDIVGTGGDMSDTFNISTTSAFVVAACGARVAKHGNRSVSSKSGAADILESLGVKIASVPEESKKLLDTIGISFLFAQSYHSSMKFVAPTRKQTGIRTIFNILGPLANPAKSEYILLGTYSKELLRPMAEVLINLGIKHAMLVHGNDCLDEISVCASTNVCEIIDSKINEYEISPEDYGIPLASGKDIKGGTPGENAQITLDILSGKLRGPKRNIVLLNSAAALYICGKAPSISEGIKLAENAIDSGKALEKLNQLIVLSNKGAA